MKIEYKAEYSDSPSVVKLYFGRKFFIWKCQALHSDVSAFIEYLQSLARDGKEYRGKLLLPVIELLQQKKFKKVTVEVISTTRMISTLITKEQEALNKYVGTASCLNTNTEPSITKNIQTENVTTNITRAFEFVMVGRHKDIHGVVRLEVGEKYFIWKCKSLQGFPVQITRDFDNKVRNGARPTDTFALLVDHARLNQITTGTIRVLFKTTNPKDLISFELKQLKKAMKDSNCLNRTGVPLIPAWIEETLNSKQ